MEAQRQTIPTKETETAHSRRLGIKDTQRWSLPAKDFLKAKSNQSQQEKRDELEISRRNFLKGQEQPNDPITEKRQGCRKVESSDRKTSVVEPTCIRTS